MSYEIDRQVGRALRFHRLRRGLSVQSLSIRVGISEARVCELEAGRVAFDRRTLLSLAAGLRTPVIAMLDGEKEAAVTFLARADNLVAIFADLFLRDYRQFERNPMFQVLNKLL